MLIGLGLFILWYSFLLLLFHSLGLDLIWTIIFFITFIPTGNFSLYYFRKAKNYQQHIRFLTIFYQKRILLYQLIEKRLSIINELNKAKDDYFANYSILTVLIFLVACTNTEKDVSGNVTLLVSTNVRGQLDPCG